jgi:hypothetical protein
MACTVRVAQTSALCSRPKFLQPVRDRQVIVVAGQQPILPGDGHSPAQQKNANSISSSAHAWSVAGRAIPWAFVVFRLATISKVVGRALNSGSVVGTSKI